MTTKPVFAAALLIAKKTPAHEPSTATAAAPSDAKISEYGKKEISKAADTQQKTERLLSALPLKPKGLTHLSAATSRKAVIATADEMDARGCNGLHQAALKGNQQAVNVLVVHKKVLINTLDAQQCTPLMLAAYNGHFRVCAMLLQAGALPQVKDAVGHTAMDLAKRANKLDVVRLLAFLQALTVLGESVSKGLAYRFFRDYLQPTSFGREAIESNIKQDGSLLINAAKGLDGKNGVFLLWQLMHDKVQLNLKDKDDRHLLTLAASSGNFLNCAILIAAGVDQGEIGQQAYQAANKAGHTVVARFLKEQAQKFLVEYLKATAMDEPEKDWIVIDPNEFPIQHQPAADLV
jgi:ankyrin repeat protein